MRKDNPNNLFEEQRKSKIQTVPVIRDASIVLSRVLGLLKLEFLTSEKNANLRFSLCRVDTYRCPPRLQ